MQKISFGDKEYVKASEIAKRFKYTQDYVGQLCRGKKVDARLVGRTWYVVPESVTSYRKTKHQTQKTTQRATKQVRTRAVKKTVSVNPVVRGKTAKILRVSSKSATSTTKTLSATYSPDETAHIPLVNSAAGGSVPTDATRTSSLKINKKVAPKKIKVIPHSRKRTVLEAEKIPEITLSAKLNVSDSFEQMIAKNAAMETAVNQSPTSNLVETKAQSDIVIGKSPKVPSVVRAAKPTLQVAARPVAKIVAPKFALVRDACVVVMGIVIASTILAASSSITVGAEQERVVVFSMRQVLETVQNLIR